MEARMRELAKRVRDLNLEKEFIESQAIAGKAEYDKLMDELFSFKKAYNLTVLLLN